MRESDLLEYIYAQSGRLASSVVIPPGDDMGAVQFGNRLLLVTVDQLAAGVHFDPVTASLMRIGRKAMTRNLSDVAAMAAQPVGAVVAAALPRDMNEDDAREIFDAMRQTGQDFACPLIGGDITIWDRPLMLTVTIFAEPAGIDPVTRAGAKVGDRIYVTNHLGGSLLEVDGYCHHLDFEPRIHLARQLAGAKHTRPTSMIDLSDGLAIDLARLCRRSYVTAELRARALPISPAAKLAADRDNHAPWQHALGDGEDYELCFTASEDAQIPAMIDDVPITCVGRITGVVGDGSPTVALHLADGDLVPVDHLGWEHGR